MNIEQLVRVDRTECAIQCASKKRILEIISQIAAQSDSALDEARVLNSLLVRERMGSTGIGNGIALPHGRLPGITDVIAVVVTTCPAVQFDAIDDKPVDIFFALLVPEEQTQGHLQTLALIASKLNDKDRVRAIRKATDKDALVQAITA